MIPSTILMTADAVGGVWTYSLDLARGLARHRVETVLAVMGPRPSAAQWREARGLRVIASDYRLEWTDHPWTDVDRAGEWLLSLEREIRPGLIHLNGYAHAALAWQAPKIVVAHSCVLSWWEAVHGEPAPAEWNEYRARAARGIQHADAVAAPSSAMLQSLAAHYGPLPHACVIPNGRDPARFLRARKEPFVFTAGRLWDRAKNLDALDRVAPSLEWPIYGAGAGGGASHLRALGILDSAGMRDWLARAAIYALPARYEPFGLSILEAALSGCALVLGDIPSLRENWDGVAAFADPADTGQLAARLRELISEQEVRAGFQRSALQRAFQFTLEKTVRGYLELYAAVLRRSQPATSLKS